MRADACVSAVMVVTVDPAVKGCGAFVAGAVDSSVGPAAEQGADEALGFAVGLRMPRARQAMACTAARYAAPLSVSNSRTVMP